MNMGYEPDRGDVVWLNFDPQKGHEQSGRRPAMVLSPRKYNGKTGLLVACPITSKVKGYPFEVSLPAGLEIQGVVLSDQVKSLDWRERRAEFVCRATEEVVEEVRCKLMLLFE